MSKPLLTIGIPTYNRAELLNRCLKALVPVLRQFGCEVQVLISDNCSTDHTTQVIEDFLATHHFETNPKVRRHESNLGLVPNIVSLFDSATTEFLIFMGDDDELILCGLERLINTLAEGPAPSGVAQIDWPWIPSRPGGQVAAEDFYRYFYEFGNSWAGVYHVPTCQTLLADPRLRREVEGSYWGQIALGMLAIERQPESKPALLDVAWGRVAQTRPYEYDHSWLVFSLSNILEAIATWQRFSSVRRRIPKKSLISYHVFRTHFIGIVLQRYTNPGMEKLPFSKLRRNLTEIYGLSGLAYYSLLRVFCTRGVNGVIRALRWLILLGFGFSRKDEIPR